MIDGRDKTRIVDTASDKFMDIGFNKVTMDEIASDLGMSKKTVYKFFPSKESLLKAIVHALMSRVENEMHEIVTSEKPIEEKLVAIFSFVGKIMRKLSRPFMLDTQRFAPALWREIEIFRRERILSQLQQIFRHAKKEGVFREDLNPDLFFLVLTTTIQGIMNPQVLAQQSFSAEEAFKGIFRIFYEGALTDKARKRFQINNISLSSNEPPRYI
jgi:AcrR family transcriptional regulator